MEDYDFIIAGGGCSGLSLAYHLSHIPNIRLLIIESQPAIRNDKTWCFWSDQQPWFPQCIRKSWSTMSFASKTDQIREHIAPYQYHYIASEDFYAFVLEALADNPLVDYQQETIQNIIPDPRGVSVHTSRKRYRAKKLFNSILPTFQPQPERIYLWQHFAGWEVEFEHDVLEPECIHLMDFQTSQANGPCFFYLLPFTHQKGLVECTVFSEKVWDKTAYEGAIHQYINTHFPDQAFQIRRREFGRIPMTNHRFGTEGHPHIIPIGTAAGLTKPTTGYTFSRIQTDSQQIVAAVSNGTPLTAHRTQGSRYTFYDDLLLYLIHHQPDQISRIFSSLFQRNPIRNILRFLDEDGSLLQDLSLILRLPWRPFLEAIWAYYLRPYRQTFPDFLTSSVSHHEPHTLSH